MGAITYSDAIAILQIVFYSPALLGSVWICLRHGFSKASGWFLLVTFCAIRLIGASGQLATISEPESSTAYTIALVCEVMGTSPLLLASLGLLTRVYTWIDNSWSSITQTFLVKIIQLVALVALILAIVGATSVSNPTQIETSTEIKAAIVLFLCCYILIVAMTLMAVCAVGSVPDGERILLKAIVLALPFIFVKILYSLMAAFSGLSDFNFVTGSKTIDLCMAVLEEIIVVILYIYAGFRVRAAPPSPEDAAARQPREYGSRRGNFSGGRMGLVSLGVNAANAAADAVQKHSRGQQAGYSSQGSHSDV